jgi:predicted metal-dependent phosphoesterase TrpH
MAADPPSANSESGGCHRETVLLDPHVHTAASYDAEGSVHEVLGYCHNRGIDAIAVTDHDTTVGARRALAASHWYDVVVIPGVEVSTADGHLLGLGVTERPPIGDPLGETVAWIRDRGGLAVVPHPFQVSRHGVRKRDLADCDGVEVFNAWSVTGIQNRRAGAYAARHGYPELGGSDAHDPSMVGRAATEVTVDADDPTAREILAAISDGRTRAVGESTAPRRYLRKYGRAAGRRLGSRAAAWTP